MRYGLFGDSAGLHQIWSMGNATTMAALSLAVVPFFAAALTAVAIRVFARSAVASSLLRPGRGEPRPHSRPTKAR